MSVLQNCDDNNGQYKDCMPGDPFAFCTRLNCVNNDERIKEFIPSDPKDFPTISDLIDKTRVGNLSENEKFTYTLFSMIHGIIGFVPKIDYFDENKLKLLIEYSIKFNRGMYNNILTKKQ